MQTLDKIISMPTQQRVLGDIVDDLQQALLKESSPNNFLILAKRGQGKSTLLHLIKKTIESDKNLNEHFKPILTPSIFYTGGLKNVIKSCLKRLKTPEREKNILLLIDDIQFSVEKSDQDTDYLRDLILTGNPKVNFIASAPLEFKVHLGYSKAFFGGVSIRELDIKDLDAEQLLKGLCGSTYQSQIIKKLERLSPFWLFNLTGNIPRLIKAFSLAINSSNNDTTIENMLDSYYALASNYFRDEYLKLPDNNRHFAETAVYSGDSFRMRELKLSMGNPAREAKELTEIGILDKIEPGVYRFQYLAMKAWLRYEKNLTPVFILNPDEATT